MRTQNVTSGTFIVGTGIKQGGMLSLVVFNIALEKVVRILQENEGSLFITEDKIRFLRFADDLDVIDDLFVDSANVDGVRRSSKEK